jgi:hypothetical protein
MGWKAIYKDGTEIDEGNAGRPVQDGENGKLLIIAQEDFGRTVAVDLINGVILFDYDSLEVVDGNPIINNAKFSFYMCDDSNIVGELAHYQPELVDWRDESGRKVIGEDGRFVKVRNDHYVPLTFRPIWFTRYTNGTPTKVIGLQTTLPKEQGGKNAKKMVMIYEDGRIGID